MPGNEFGDRVHNFFVPDNLSQGQHPSYVLQGNWPDLNSNVWVNGQIQVDVTNSSSNNYTSQNSDIDKRQTSYQINAANGLNISRSDLGPDFCKNQSLNEQPYTNGFMYGDQFYRNRQNESNFLPVNTNSDQHHLITSRGLPAHGLQQGYGSEQQGKALCRLETSLPSVSFDIFGGQQQISHQQATMMQAIQHQQPGLNDMQHMQQQLFIQKMQDLQRQQQLRQSGLRTQDLMNQASPININVSGHQSTLVMGIPNSDTLHEPGTNWLSRGSSSMQGSPSGIVFPPNVGQTQHVMDLVPQQVDQSLYGVPVSSSRGLAVNHFRQMELDGSMPQMLTLSNSQHKFLPDQNGSSSKNFQTENIFGHSSSQSINSVMRDTGGLQHMNSTQRNVPQHDYRGQQRLDTLSETLHERLPRQVASSQNEVALDPAEEKILYGSDDNIWAVFGKSHNMSGEAGNLFDNVGVSNELPSIQNGRWSALMQSAVAETSSSDLGPQEWSGAAFHNTDSSPVNRTHATCLPNENLQIPSALSTASITPSVDLNSLNVMGLNQLGPEFQSVPVQRVPNDTPHIFGQSLEEVSKQLNPILLQKSFAKGNLIHGNASQHSLSAENGVKTSSASWASLQSGPRDQLNDLKVPAGVRSGGDRSWNIHDNEKSQNSWDNQSRVIQGEVAHGSSLWKSNSVLSSTEFGHVKSTVENHQTNIGVLSLNGAPSSEKDSCAMGVGRETSPFAKNNFFLNQWKATHPSAKFHGGENLGRMLDKANGQCQGLTSLSGCDKDGVTRPDVEICAKKENSNDSHHSNLSQHASGGHRENKLTDSIDSRSFALGKQKSTNQFSVKDSIHRKFQYHPMGNLDEVEVPTFCLKQRSEDVHQKDTRPPLGSGTSSKASSQGQNMLELFQKLDQSGDHVASSHLSSECNLPSQLPTTNKIDGSSVSQSFGLELGPPSLRLQTSELSTSSPNARGMIDSMHTCQVGAEMKGKGLPRIPSSSLQSVPFPIVESQVELKNGGSEPPRHHGTENTLYKMKRNYNPAFSSDSQFVRNQLENMQIASEKMALNRHHESPFSGSTPQFMQREFAENVRPDSSHQIQKDDPPSRGMNDERNSGPAATSSRCNSQRSGSPEISEPGVSSQVLHNVMTRFHAPEQTLAAQKPKAPLQFSELSQLNIVESSSQGELNVGKEANLSSKLGAIHTNSHGVDKDQHRVNIDCDPNMEGSLGKLSSVKSHLDDSPANSASTWKDIQAFGRSLKPNNFSNERYAVLSQMRVSRDVESDPSVRASKRLKGSDDNLDDRVNLMPGQQNEGGVRALSSPRPSNGLQRNTYPHGHVTSQDTVVPGLDASQSHPSTNCATSVGAEHQVSPQTAPSWFNQYGNFENGQMLPVHSAHQVASLKPSESLFILGNAPGVLSTLNSQEKIASVPTLVDACQVDGTLLNSSSTSVANEHLPSPEPLQLNVTPQLQVISRPNKRKTATSELHPWHKEISDGSKALSTLSVAEAHWSKAANRRSEKVEDDTDLIEDVHPLLRLKRRLILTTQLTQLLFCPPSANILSSDASTTYECVTYAISRLTLGDACSSISFSRNLGLPRDVVNLHPKGELNGDQQFVKAIEELSRKARKLENDFLRLDKCASVLDSRLEIQGMEKYSVINRFGKFHVQGQNDCVETASTNAMACVQRYVTPLPMPRNIPDGLKCLSL